MITVLPLPLISCLLGVSRSPSNCSLFSDPGIHTHSSSSSSSSSSHVFSLHATRLNLCFALLASPFLCDMKKMRGGGAKITKRENEGKRCSVTFVFIMIIIHFSSLLPLDDNDWRQVIIRRKTEIQTESKRRQNSSMCKGSAQMEIRSCPRKTIEWEAHENFYSFVSQESSRHEMTMIQLRKLVRKSEKRMRSTMILSSRVMMNTQK